MLQALVRFLSGNRSLIQRMDTAFFVSSSAAIGAVLADDTRKFAARVQVAPFPRFFSKASDHGRYLEQCSCRD